MKEPASDRPVNVVIGTAGHIDHGKSSLVQRLTGKHPSRLKEEIERGMTIDIGFSEWKIDERTTAGIIDVPGHEKFVRNMVAGSAGVDLALLVVAADDGIMQQTREHVQIMRMLGIKNGLTVLTKIDVVDPTLREIVIEDVREYLKGTFLAEAPIMPVSNLTGEGIEELKAEILRRLETVPRRPEGGVFRMPINRSFSVKGHGTVVTGVPVSGSIAVGAELEILPRGDAVRVRGIHVHHVAADEARAGHRAALNVTDVDHKQIRRGDVIATRGYFSSSTLLEVRFEYLDHYEQPLENDLEIRFHGGTAEVGGRLILLDKKSLMPGESCLAQLRLEEPVVVAAGDRYIVRLASPVMTLGGGTIVGETRWRFKRFRDWLNENIAQKEAHLDDPMGYLEYVVRSQATAPATTEEIAKIVKTAPDETLDRLKKLQEAKDVVAVDAGRRWIHFDMFQRAVSETSDALLEMHKADKLRGGFQIGQVAKATKFPVELVEPVLAALIERKKVEALKDKLFRHREFSGGLSHEDMRVLGAISEMHSRELFGAPIFSEIVAGVAKPEKKVKELVTYLIQMGEIVPIAEDLCLHKNAVLEAERRLIARLKIDPPMASAEFKDIISASRKYVIPLLEYFDKKGISRRDGNVRKLAPGWEKKVSAGPDQPPGA